MLVDWIGRHHQEDGSYLLQGKGATVTVMFRVLWSRVQDSES